MNNQEDIIVRFVHEGIHVNLRPANKNDLLNLREWKNHNREFFFFKDEISIEQQREWFSEYEIRTNDFMFIVSDNDSPIGCMGIRLIENVWDVYNVILGLSEYKGKCIMGASLKKMLNFAVIVYQNPITLKVLKHNPAVSWYKKNGFIIKSEKSEFYFMSYETLNF